MSPVSLLSFCSPSGDTEIICQLPKSLWALVLEIHFPERGTAQCHPLLILLVKQRPKTDGLATQLGHCTGPNPASFRELGASQHLLN